MRFSLREFYKELYFHEIDVREKLNSRIQIPLAIILSMIGGLSFMTPRLNIVVYDLFLIGYLVCFCLTCISLIIATLFLIRSFFGHEYSFLPTARDCEDYRILLGETYKGYENADELVEEHFEKFIVNEYVNSSTINTNCNDQRSLLLHFTNRFLIASILSIAVTFALFQAANWRGSLETEPIKMEIVDSLLKENG